MKPITLKPHEITPLLEGKEVEVRREVKPQPEGTPYSTDEWANNLANAQGITWRSDPTEAEIKEKGERLRGRIFPFRRGDGRRYAIRCPLGTVGEIRWVREVWVSWDGGLAYKTQCLDRYGKEDLDSKRCRTDYGVKWKSPVTMPMWASRLNVKILSVKVEKKDKWEWVVRVKRNENE